MKIRAFLLMSAAFAGPAMAQQAATTEGGLEDIIVTANKRAENVQTVAASISVLSAQSLAANGISAPDKLSMVTPGLVFETTNGFAQPFIRGVGSDQVTPTAELPTSIYLDGVYISTPSAGLQEFGDVERVEVLKGPQGTLYGRNSTGGAINIITRTPKPGMSGNASMTIGDHGIRRGLVYFGGGTEKVRASFSGVYTTRDGWMKNLVNGVGLNDEDRGGFRGKFVLAPNDVWTITLSGDYFRIDDQSGEGFTSVSGKPLAALLGGRFSANPRETYTNITDLKHTERQWGLAGNVRGSFDGFDAVSITGYRKTTRFSYTDLDGSDLPVLSVAGPQFLKSFSQEFQLVSNNSGPLEWIAGAYYFYSNGGFANLTVDAGPTTVPRYTDIIGIQSTRAYAAFGQAKYSFTDNWSLTLGGRYNREKKALTKSQVTIRDFGLVIPFPSDSRTNKNFSPKASLEYKADDILLYASASKGFKSGQFNTAGPGDPPVDPEKITAFEIGGKHTLLDRHLRFNWAGFFYDYKNLQVVTIAGGNGLTRLQNAASSRTYGIDVDATAVLSSQLRVTLAGEWLHSRYRKFDNAQIFVSDSSRGGFGFVTADCTLASKPCDVSGNDTTRSPHVSGSAQIDYTVPVSLGELQFNAAYRYSSSYYFDSANKIKQGAYHQLNLRAGIALDKGITLTAFVDNVFNETVLAGVAQTALITLGQYTAPRTFGVTAAVKF